MATPSPELARSSAHGKADDTEHVSLKVDARPAPTNPSTWKVLRVIAGPFVTNSATRWRAMVLIVGTLMALILESGLIIRFSEVQKGFLAALEAKQKRKFYAGLREVMRVIAASLPVAGFRSLVQQTLELEWRTSITRSMAQRYLAGGGPNGRGAFYQLSLDGILDNPDQRICQDVADFVKNGITLSIDLFGAAMRVLGFAQVLYRISPAVCAGTVAYTTLCTAGALGGFGPPIFKSQIRITQQEATLRYCLIRVREHAESVAFFRGGPSEWQQFQELFASLRATMYTKIRQIVTFVIVNHGVKYSTVTIPVLLVGPRYMRGEADFGMISQVSFAYTVIFEALMLIMEKLPELASLSVQGARLEALRTALEDDAGATAEASTSAALMRSPGRSGSIMLETSAQDDAGVLEVSDMTLRTPPRAGSQQQTIIEDLTFELRGGTSLLIVGESGIGKSSLLRAFAGLWSSGSGSVRRCSDDTVFFMPQRPYMCLGTLREQLLYPRAHRLDASDTTICNMLQQVNLSYLLDRHGLDAVQDWAAMLSLGEQQRINFARALLQPNLKLALIDEGTSACDPESEGRLYAALKQKLKSYVSVGHRPILRRYHTHALVLQRGGPPDPEMSPVQHSNKSGAMESSTRHTFLPIAEFDDFSLAL